MRKEQNEKKECRKTIAMEKEITAMEERIAIDKKNCYIMKKKKNRLLQEKVKERLMQEKEKEIFWKRKKMKDNFS